MSEFLEHNNRKIAKKHAEYITGKALRQYLASKVKKYLGESPLTVFDGAVGSGQLEQFINVGKLYGCDIQEKAIETCKKNYSNNDLKRCSFFQLPNYVTCDCVIMNPPFSLKFKELSEEDRASIQKEFTWKKSGVVDDIFLLKSLNYTKRYAFHIAFPGIGYRATERKMRELIGDTLLELNLIENAFEDTSISVLFIVIDKEKTDKRVYQEIYDCKACKVLTSKENEITTERWELPRVEEEKEEVDIKLVNREVEELTIRHVENSLSAAVSLYADFSTFFEDVPDPRELINAIRTLCNKYETILNKINEGIKG